MAAKTRSAPRRSRRKSCTSATRGAIWRASLWTAKFACELAEGAQLGPVGGAAASQHAQARVGERIAPAVVRGRPLEPIDAGDVICAPMRGQQRDPAAEPLRHPTVRGRGEELLARVALRRGPRKLGHA